MKKFLSTHSRKIGVESGTIVHIGKKRLKTSLVRVFDYNEKMVIEKEVKKIETVFPMKKRPTVTWINIDGLQDTKIIEKVGIHYDVHPLVLEDIAHTGQRPKLEDFDDYIFVVLKTLYYDKKQEIHAEQISLLLGKNFVFSFQEKTGDCFDDIRMRIRKSKGRIRKFGPDYLVYTLLDAIVDSYFSILEKFGDQIEDLEDEVLDNPTKKTREKIYSVKREMIFLRKSIWPLREVIGGLARSESDLISDATKIYLKDVYDHTIQVIDTVESFRDMATSLLDSYLSSLSNKMNEIMKVLTIFAAIFIPLTFFSGVYGMNFEHMPELAHEYGYFIWWGCIIVLTTIMIVIFKKKKWF